MFNLTTIALEYLNLTAAVNNNFVVFQGATAGMPFGIGAAHYNATNSTTDAWVPAVEIISAPTQGTLHRAGRANQEALAPGVVLTLEEDGTTPVVYSILNHTDFSLPTTTADQVPLSDQTMDSFEFRLLALNASTYEILSSTETVQQPIPVLNVNDPPTLSAPPLANITTEKSVLGRYWYEITGIIIDDHLDRDVDLVRVDIWALNGTISLHEDWLDLADFSSCSVRQYTDWRCQGRGKHDRNATFVATPENANKLLEHVRYRPYYKNIEDAVYIRVHDGAGGECLDPAEHALYGNDVLSYHPRCVTLEATVDVLTPVESGAPADGTGFDSIPKVFGIPITAFLFWGLVAVVLFSVMFCMYHCCLRICSCCCCCFSKKKKKAQRNKSNKKKKNGKRRNGNKSNTKTTTTNNRTKTGTKRTQTGTKKTTTKSNKSSTMKHPFRGDEMESRDHPVVHQPHEPIYNRPRLDAQEEGPRLDLEQQQVAPEMYDYYYNNDNDDDCYSEYMAEASWEADWDVTSARSGRNVVIEWGDIV